MGLLNSSCEWRHVHGHPVAAGSGTETSFSLPRECAAAFVTLVCLFPAGEDSQGAGNRRSV